MTDDVLTLVRATNSLLAFGSLTLFAAFLSYHRGAVPPGARALGLGLLWLFTCISISSGWRAAHGPEWVPSAVLLCGLAPLFLLMVRDMFTRQRRIGMRSEKP